MLCFGSIWAQKFYQQSLIKLIKNSRIGIGLGFREDNIVIYSPCKGKFYQRCLNPASWVFRLSRGCRDCVSLHRLRLILPQQSVCQSIFFKLQGTYLLYAIMWLVRPLIKNILDSSPRYLPNVTFGTSLAFRMREEYIFEKNYFWNLDLKGLTIGVTQFHMQLCMFLDILEPRIENCLGKTVLKILFQICKKNCLCVHKKVQKLKKK